MSGHGLQSTARAVVAALDLANEIKDWRMVFVARNKLIEAHDAMVDAPHTWAKVWKLAATLYRRRIAELENRRDEHLRLISNMSRESISPEEAEELRGQIASLIAEVGTLRNRIPVDDDDDPERMRNIVKVYAAYEMVYAATCLKCNDRIGGRDDTVIAQNENQAYEKLQGVIKDHDFKHHGSDGEPPEFGIVVFQIRRTRNFRV